MNVNNAITLDKLNEDITSLSRNLYLESPDLWIDFSDKMSDNIFDEMVLFFAIKYNYPSIVKHTISNNLIDLDSPSKNKTFHSIKEHLLNIADINISNYIQGVNEDIQILDNDSDLESNSKDNSYSPEFICPNCKSNVMDTGYIVSEEITYKFSKKLNKAISTSSKPLDSVSCTNCGSVLKETSPHTLQNICTIQNCTSCGLDLTTTGIIDKVKMIYDKDSNKFINSHTSHHCSNCDKEVNKLQAEYFNL